MNGNYLNKILGIDAEHALYREDGKWYHNLKSFPGVLFDKNGLIIFHSEADYQNHPYLQIKKDLHVIGGIQNLPEYRRFTELELSFINAVEFSAENNTNDDVTNRIKREIQVILRKKSLVDQIKKLYENQCQICGVKLQIEDDRYYSEVHHIIPLGKPFNGNDQRNNMICVCPNHHALLDFRAIPINLEKLKLNKHKISSEHIEHHNALVKK